MSAFSGLGIDLVERLRRRNMTQLTISRRQRQRAKMDELFEQASAKWDDGQARAAFRLFLKGAKLGDSGSQLNLGTFYADGIGVKPSRDLALYWYRRAYRRGERCAASNIGALFRDEQNLRQALKWYERAVMLGDSDANLEIAKILLQRGESDKAAAFLVATLNAKTDDVTEASRDEAGRLLKQIA